MPKPKRRAVLVESIEEEKPVTEQVIVEEDALLEEQQAKEWLADFQSRFSDQPVRILIEKYDDSGDWAVCRKYPLSSFDQEAIFQEFGPGKYRGTLFDPKGHYIQGGRCHFKFAQPLHRDGPIMMKPENPFENPMVIMMMESLKAQQVQMMELMKSIMTSQATASQAAPKPAGLGEIVEVMKSLRTITPQEQKPLDSFKETLGLMKLVKEVTGDSDSDSKGGLLSEIKEFLEIYPSLKEVLPTLKPQNQIPAVAGPQVPIQGAKPEMDPLAKKVVEIVPKFAEAGAAAAPVPEWGAYLLEIFDTEFVPLLLPSLKAQYKALVKSEDDVYDIVIRLAKDEAEREKIFKVIPALRPHKEWCNRVMDEAIRLAETDDETDGPQAGVVLDAVSANGDA